MGSARLRALAEKLSSLALQVKAFSEQECGGYELGALDATMREVKQTLLPANVRRFEARVETSVTFIKPGMAGQHPAAESGGGLGRWEGLSRVEPRRRGTGAEGAAAGRTDGGLTLNSNVFGLS